MAIKRGVSTDGQFLPAATGTLYSLNANVTRAVITSVTMFATLATTNTKLYIVPNAASPTGANQTLDKNFAILETYTAPELIGQSIEFGGEIQGEDGIVSGAAVNIIITVTEFSGDS